MRCSIMLITYNRSKEVLRAVQSCVPFMDETMELVIVDNNSPDDTQVVLEKYLKEANVRFTYHRSPVNLGVAGGRNLAYSLCQGDYVFSLDDDAVIVTEDFFQKMIRFMEEYPKVAAAEVVILEPETSTDLNCPFTSTEKGLTLIRSFCGCAHVLRKSFYQNGPLYPAKLFFGSEELYPSLQAWGKDQQVALIESLIVHHRPSMINRVAGKERIFNILVNTYIVKTLCYPKSMRPLMKLILILRLRRYRLWDPTWRRKLKETLNERYDPKEAFPISRSVVHGLIRRFGFFAIL